MPAASRRSKAKPKNVHVNLVLPGDVLAEVDAVAVRIGEASPGYTITRSDVVRRAVYAFLKEFNKPPVAGKTPKEI